ncbi:TPA: hypothetical protein QEK28_001044 [Stenotrophomonas maltophilia]|nr:hypothetical protein [Stenotrophomonas maltophilia]
MSGPNLERFVNAIASDLEEGGFREVTGTTLRRNLTTAVQAALPLLSAQAGGTALSAHPSPGGQGGLNYERMFVDACAALAEVSRELGCDPEQGGAEPILAAIAALREALAARQPVGEPVCSGGFVISNGSGEKYMAWGQVGPEWTADRSAALWLVRRADAEALAAENEDAWSILPVERCALPPNGWACTLADGHEGPCPTIVARPAQAIFLERYDAGLLSDVGGGDTAWWLNYLRSELGRAHDHYQHQVNPATEAGHG